MGSVFIFTMKMDVIANEGVLIDDVDGGAPKASSNNNQLIS